MPYHPQQRPHNCCPSLLMSLQQGCTKTYIILYHISLSFVPYLHHRGHAHASVILCSDVRCVVWHFLGRPEKRFTPGRTAMSHQRNCSIKVYLDEPMHLLRLLTQTWARGYFSICDSKPALSSKEYHPAWMIICTPTILELPTQLVGNLTRVFFLLQPLCCLHSLWDGLCSFFGSPSPEKFMSSLSLVGFLSFLSFRSFPLSFRSVFNNSLSLTSTSLWLSIHGAYIFDEWILQGIQSP